MLPARCEASDNVACAARILEAAFCLPLTEPRGYDYDYDYDYGEDDLDGI